VAKLQPESVYKAIADDRLKDSKISRVRDAVSAVVDDYTSHQDDGLSVVVTGHAKKMIVDAIYGIKADPNSRWADFDVSNNNKLIQYMATATARVPAMIDDIANKQQKGQNAIVARVTYSDLLHNIGDFVDKICPIKKV
jgi:hypothetical protein